MPFHTPAYYGVPVLAGAEMKSIHANQIVPIFILVIIGNPFIITF